MTTFSNFWLRQNQSDRANYGALYPRGVERTRGFFSDDIVAPVHICLDAPSLGRDEQPPMYPPPQVALPFLDRLQIQERAPGGVAFIAHPDAETRQFRFVAQHLDEAGMGDRHEVLVVALPQFDLLLPEVILADDQGANALLHQVLDDPAARQVQLVVNAAIAPIGQALEPFRRNPHPQAGLEFCPALVVILVDGLQGAAINDYRREAGLVCSYRRQIVQTNIYPGAPVRVQVLSPLGQLLVDDLHGVMGFVRHDPHLLNRLSGGNFDRQARRLHHPPLQASPADRLDRVREQIAPCRFRLVLRQLRASHESRWIFSVGLAGRKEGTPIMIHLAQHPLRYLARQGAVVRRVFHELVQLWVGEIRVLEDERLAHEVIGGVVKVLGQKRRLVDHLKAGIGVRDDVLLNQLHRLGALLLKRRSGQIMGQPGDDPFRPAFRAPLTVQSCAERGDNTHEVLGQIFFAILGQVDDLDGAVLQFQQLLDGVEAKARHAILVLHRDPRDQRIGQQFHRFGPSVVDPRADLFDHQGSAVILQAFGLPVQVLFVLGCRDAGVDRDFGGVPRGCGDFKGLGDQNGTGVHRVAVDHAAFEPTEGCAVGNANLTRLCVEFHALILAQTFCYVNICTKNE